MEEGSREIELLLKRDYFDDRTSTNDYIPVPPLPDIHTSEPIKVYRRRWYILAVYATLAVLSTFYTNTFSPIQEPVKLIFHWKDWNILLFNALAMISLLFASAPFAWLAVSKGLRPAVVLTAGFLFLGKALQILPFINKTVDTLLMNIGQLISSLSFPICFGAQTFVSSIWFPPNQRTTATTIGTLSGSVGIAIGFLIPPVFVPYSGAKLHNGSMGNDSVVRLGDMRSQFKGLMYFQAALGLAAFVAVLAYFPNKPPLPPSRSSTEEHHHQNLKFGLHVRHLLRNGSFWLLAILYAVEFGVTTGWQLLLNVMLSKLGISQQTASLLGCGTSLSGIVSALIVSRIADYYNRSTKTILILLFACSTILITVFSLTCEGIIPYSTPLIYVTCILPYMLTIDANPLLFELAVEGTYPVPEVLSTSFMSFLSSVVSVFFNIVFSLPNMDIRWINWVFAGSVAVCVPGLLLYKVKYTRQDIDTASN